MESRLITPIHLPPLKPPFPRWYDPNTHCDFHCGNPGHSIKNCTALKNKVQDLKQVGSMEFETSDEQEGDGSQFSNSSKGKASMIMQAMGTMDEMPTAMKGSQNDKTKGKDIVYSSTIEKSEKQPHETVKAKVKLGEEEEECSHEEKKTVGALMLASFSLYVNILLFLPLARPLS